MAIFTLLIIAILTSSCGMPIIGKHMERKSGTSRLFSSTDNTFAPYVAQFEAYGKSISNNDNFSVGDVIVNFGVPEENAFQGVCYIYSNDAREIIIRADWWNNASDSDKESLLFHELGHCRLDREHDDSTEVIANQSVKLSMMHTVIVLGGQYSNHRSGYLTEMFTGNKSAVRSTFINMP